MVTVWSCDTDGSEQLHLFYGVNTKRREKDEKI